MEETRNSRLLPSKRPCFTAWNATFRAAKRGILYTGTCGCGRTLCKHGQAPCISRTYFQGITSVYQLSANR